MRSLHDIQLALAVAIVEQDTSHVECYIAGTDIHERLAVYLNNVYHNLREALRAVYPVVERLVGEHFFNHAANRYIHDNPSLSGDIQCFGSSFPAFLASFPPAASLSYLADTATLEWTMHEVFHAADHEPLAMSQLARLSGADCSTLRFRLHPACRLFASNFPVLKIWQTNQPDANMNEAVDMRARGDRLLIKRTSFAIDVQPLEAGEFVMLQALLAGEAIDDAYELALQADCDFRLGEFILRRITDATLVDFIAFPGMTDVNPGR